MCAHMHVHLTEKLLPSKSVWEIPEDSHMRTRLSVEFFCSKSLCVTDYLVADICLCVCVLLNLYLWWHLSTVIKYIHLEISWPVCGKLGIFLSTMLNQGLEAWTFTNLSRMGRKQGSDIFKAWFFTEEHIQLLYILTHSNTFTQKDWVNI